MIGEARRSYTDQGWPTALHQRACREAFTRSIPMMDVVMLAIGFAFFALSIAYVYACDQL